MKRLVKDFRRFVVVIISAFIIAVVLQLVSVDLGVSAGTGDSSTVDVIKFKPEKTSVEIKRNINEDNHVREISFNKVGDLEVYGAIRIDTLLSEEIEVIDVKKLKDSIGNDVAIFLSQDVLAQFNPVEEDIIVLDGEKVMRMELRVSMEDYHAIEAYSFDLALMEEQGLMYNDYSLEIDFRTVTEDNTKNTPMAWFNVLSVESETE